MVYTVITATQRNREGDRDLRLTSGKKYEALAEK
jgi:hypothetical protein